MELSLGYLLRQLRPLIDHAVEHLLILGLQVLDQHRKSQIHQEVVADLDRDDEDQS